MGLLDEIRSPQFMAQTARFILVGIGGTAIYAGTAYGLLGLGYSLLISHIIAYTVSIAASYAGQKIFTFGIRGQHRRNGPRFIFATVLLAVTQFILVLILEHFGLNDQLIVLASTLFYPPASFLLHTFWTFRPRETQPS